MCLNKLIDVFKSKQKVNLLTSDQVKEKVMQMKAGDNERFKIFIDDPICKSRHKFETFIAFLSFDLGSATYCNYWVKKDHILLEVNVW